MTLWDWVFISYSLVAGIFTFAWLWKTRLDKKPRTDKPCNCLHPIRCDMFDKCMRGEK